MGDPPPALLQSALLDTPQAHRQAPSLRAHDGPMGQPPEERSTRTCPQERPLWEAGPCPGASEGETSLTAAREHPSDTAKVQDPQAGPHLWPRGLPLPHPQSGNIGSSGHLFFYLCPPPPARPKPAMTQAGRIRASFLAEAGASVGRPKLLRSHRAPPRFPWPQEPPPTRATLRQLSPGARAPSCFCSPPRPSSPARPLPQGLCRTVTPANPTAASLRSWPLRSGRAVTRD